MRPLIKKVRTQEHANGKSVSILRDYSMQVQIVQAALRRKRKNDVRNASSITNVPVHGADINVPEHVQAAESASAGYSADGTYNGSAVALFGLAGLRSASGRTSTESPNLQNIRPRLSKEQRAEVERVRAGLRESDGVGRVQEPALRGDGGDSSLSDQSG